MQNIGIAGLIIFSALSFFIEKLPIISDDIFSTKTHFV
jgi:hypothetical protein